MSDRGLILDNYLKDHHPGRKSNNEKSEKYLVMSEKMLEKANFLIFPKEKIVSQGDDNTVKANSYRCDLVVLDENFSGEIIEKEILLNQSEHLQSFDVLKNYLQLQEPTVTFEVFKKDEKDSFCDNLRLWGIIGYEKVFGVKTGYKIPRVGFDIKNNNKFIFNNGILDVKSGRFKTGDYQIEQNTSIDIRYPLDEIKNLDLNQSLTDCLSIEKYISSEKDISAIILGYMVAGIFRKDYKAIHNEFPFLGIEAYTGCGKTSLLNLLSWISGYNRDSIGGVCDSDYAFEVGMDCMGGWFYYFDEIQKASAKLLKYIQAAYNSGENHKGGANGNWSELQVYRKDCSLICTGELLPQQEEALLNRFIVLCPSTPFLIKKNVKDEEEFEKYRQLGGQYTANKEYLSTEQIKILAIKYYRPRFLKILQQKDEINFKSYHDKAVCLIEKYADDKIDIRLINNLIPAITGYLILLGEDGNIGNNEELIGDIIGSYFHKLMQYRKDSIVSGKIVEYIINHPGEYAGWIGKVKGTSQNYPMIYLKNSEREQGLVIQIPSLIKFTKDKIESDLAVKHIEQQFRQLLGIQTKQKDTKVVKVAKGSLNMNGVFVPYEKVKRNEALQNIWDVMLSYLGEHSDELNHILKGEDKEDSGFGATKQPIQKCMPNSILEKLIEEIDTSYEISEFFDKNTFQKKEQDPF